MKRAKTKRGRKRGVSKFIPSHEPERFLAQLMEGTDCVADLSPNEAAQLRTLKGVLRGNGIDIFEAKLPRNIITEHLLDCLRMVRAVATRKMSVEKFAARLRALSVIDEREAPREQQLRRAVGIALQAFGSLTERRINCTEAELRAWIRGRFPGLLKPKDRSTLNKFLLAAEVTCRRVPTLVPAKR